MNYASSILGLLPGGRRAPGIGQLISKIEAYLPPDQVERVREAFEYAETAHKGQKRKSGEAFITHPVAVADILADLHLDGATIAAAVLHDVVEDTPSSMATASASRRPEYSATLLVVWPRYPLISMSSPSLVVMWTP
jgi:hypothetical protein